MAEMALPIGRSDLVADQPVDCVGVRDAQQRLGEAHQRDALGRGQRVFLQEGVEPALAVALAAHRNDQAARGGGDPPLRIGRDRGIGEDLRIGRGLILAVRVADRRPEGRFGWRRGRENEIHARLLRA